MPWWPSECQHTIYCQKATYKAVIAVVIATTPMLWFTTNCDEISQFKCHFEWIISTLLKMCQFHNFAHMIVQHHWSTVKNVVKFEQIPDSVHRHFIQICKARINSIMMMTVNRVRIKCHFKSHHFRRIVDDFVIEITRGKSIEHNKWLALEKSTKAKFSQRKQSKSKQSQTKKHSHAAVICIHATTRSSLLSKFIDMMRSINNKITIQNTKSMSPSSLFLWCCGFCLE